MAYTVVSTFLSPAFLAFRRIITPICPPETAFCPPSHCHNTVCSPYSHYVPSTAVSPKRRWTFSGSLRLLTHVRAAVVFAGSAEAPSSGPGLCSPAIPTRPRLVKRRPRRPDFRATARRLLALVNLVPRGLALEKAATRGAG